MYKVLGSIPNTIKKKRQKAQVFQKWRARSRACVAAGCPLRRVDVPLRRVAEERRWDRGRHLLLLKIEIWMAAD